MSRQGNLGELVSTYRVFEITSLRAPKWVIRVQETLMDFIGEFKLLKKGRLPDTLYVYSRDYTGLMRIAREKLQEKKIQLTFRGIHVKRYSE